MQSVGPYSFQFYYHTNPSPHGRAYVDGLHSTCDSGSYLIHSLHGSSQAKSLAGSQPQPQSHRWQKYHSNRLVVPPTSSQTRTLLENRSLFIGFCALMLHFNARVGLFLRNVVVIYSSLCSPSDRPRPGAQPIYQERPSAMAYSLPRQTTAKLVHCSPMKKDQSLKGFYTTGVSTGISGTSGYAGNAGR